MRLTKKLASVGSAVIVTATFGLAAAPAAHAAAPAPLDPTQWSVACDSLTGSIKFATALSLAPSSSNNTITVKATTSGCAVPQTGNVATGDPMNCINPSQKITTGPSGTTVVGTAITLSGLDAANSFRLGAGPVGEVGATIAATGSGIPVGDTIASVTSTTHATLTTASTTAGSSLSFKLVTVQATGQPCVNIAPAKLGGVLTSLAGHNQTPPVADSSGCLGLSGLSTGTSGVNITQIKNQAKGLDNLTPLPKLLDAGSGSTNANVTSGVSATFGTTFSDDAWGASYGEFQLGLVQTDAGPVQATPAFTRNNSTPAGSAGNAFQGGDSGHSDGFDGTTGESSGAILIACLGKGVKAITFGIGHVDFG